MVCHPKQLLLRELDVGEGVFAHEGDKEWADTDLARATQAASVEHRDPGLSNEKDEHAGCNPRTKKQKSLPKSFHYKLFDPMVTEEIEQT